MIYLAWYFFNLTLDFLHYKNDKIAGLFRVKYSDELLKRLLPALKNQALGAADRLGIQQDLFALAKAGTEAHSTYPSCLLLSSQLFLINCCSFVQYYQAIT